MFWIGRERKMVSETMLAFPLAECFIRIHALPNMAFRTFLQFSALGLGEGLLNDHWRPHPSFILTRPARDRRNSVSHFRDF